MSFLQVGDVKSRVKRQFGDESGVQVVDSDIYSWISDAIRHITLNNEEVIEASATIDVVANQQDYDLPADVIALKGITYRSPDVTSYFNIIGYPLEQFNTYVDGWDGGFFGNGQAAIYTLFNNKIKLFPIPSTAAIAALKVYYTTYLAEINSDIEIALPRLYFNIIVDYCLQKAYEMDEDWIAAEIKMQTIQQELHVIRGKGKRQQDTFPVITVLDDDRW